MPYTGGYPRPGRYAVRGRYSFAVDGGAVGTIAITSGTPIPAGAYITGGFIEVDTNMTSGGSATVALRVEGAGDILAATAFDNAALLAGLRSVVPAGTGATAVKTTAARDISVVIATAALTAGIFDVVLFYTVLGD